jgi:tetratricopeptide (TPR) repeat protein
MKKLRDVDATKRAHLVRILGLSSFGAVLGATAGGLLFGLAGFLLGIPVGALLVFLVTSAASSLAGATAVTFFSPSGNSNPAKREYSRPQALVALGHYEEAIKAYEACCAEFPEDPEPYVRIARIYRSELQRFDEAVSWFKKGRSQSKMTPALEQLVTQEIIEVYTQRLAAPQRAIPELARLADRFPDTEAAAWARQRLQELRAAIASGEASQ